MAINAFDECENYESPKMGCNVKGAGTPPPITNGRTNCDIDESAIKRGRTRKKKMSPNLHDKVQLLTSMTEKRFVRKKNEVFSSFPLAAQIYSASSAEFKAYKKCRQKPKKSVLTLPNSPDLMPEACTVSDMNDSDYYKRKNEPKRMGNKRLPNQNQKMRIKAKGFEVFDRDEKHIYLDCSLTDLGDSKYGGDGRKVSGRMQKSPNKDIPCLENVWSVLRNINKFQFSPSTRISNDSIDSPHKKKKVFKRRYANLRKTRRLVETRHTEEIAYIASIEIQSKTSTSASRSSSFDRVTVINKKELENTKELEHDIPKPNLQRMTFKPRRGVFKPIQNLKPNTKIKRENDNEMKKKYSALSIKESLDSSNCFRQSENDLRNISSNNFKTKPVLTHPDAIKEIIYNNGTQPYIGRPNTELPYAEKMTRGVTDITQKPKPRLVTTMPSASAMPKMSAFEIKRKLALIRYPLVILGKDQLSSNMEVVDYESPQFKGLDERIWPFMAQWSTSNKYKKGQANNRMLPIEYIAKDLRKDNSDLLETRPKDKRPTTYDIASKKKKVERETNVNEVIIPSLAKKSKPIRQFKDKMLKLLYKKSSASLMEDFVEQVTSEKPRQPKDVEIQNGVAVCTETSVPSKKVLNKVETMVKVKREMPKTPEEILEAFNKGHIIAGRKVSEAKYPWAKAKWASDFIDNVMEKINSGVYYSREQNNLINNQNCGLTVKLTQKIDIGTCIDFRDVSIQTLSSVENITKKPDFETNLCQSRSNSMTEIHNDDILLNIPGFDEVLPEFEIKTLNVNQIAVKHCMANVMVQFDVAVPNKLNSFMQLDEKTSVSSTCIPLSVTSSQTKIFKCSTTILNAVLPAELCTVIPKLMRHIFESSTTYSSSFSDMNTTLSDLSMCEPMYPVMNPSPVINPSPVMNPSPVRNRSNASMGLLAHPWAAPTSQWIGQRNLCIPCCRPDYLPLYMSPLLKKFITGRFPSSNLRIHRPKRVSRNEVIRNIELKRSENVILPQPYTKVLMGIMSDPMKQVYSVPDANVIVPRNAQLSTDKQMGNCTTIQLYKRNEPREISYPVDFTNLLQSTWIYYKFNIDFNVPQYVMAPLNNKLKTFNLLVGNNQSTQNAISVTITNFSSNSYCTSLTDTIFKSPLKISAKSAYPRSVTPLLVKSLEKPEESPFDTEPETKQLARKFSGKTRKRGFIRLYRKCKSASNMSTEKYCTPLNRIVNIEDFIEALGAAKTFSSVFSGEAGHKLLSCVDEMKSWIKDITPRQALLVLLLTNKKDTTTLVRFRPVLLQGIAVNRITRVTELDMEIEVIEKENVHTTQQGVPFIPAPVDNQDSLLEELCWIAKTTASDYQRPFNETSEKLLKALLGKRKKLNPSYLRVLARYVGLGLLKTPNKN